MLKAALATVALMTPQGNEARYVAERELVAISGAIFRTGCTIGDLSPPVRSGARGAHRRRGRRRDGRPLA
jgi:hypothetical protein